jgi:membrane-bound lytic murein transglycosylase D
LGNEPDEPISYETVKVDKPMKLKDIARHLDIPENDLNALNTELRYKITPDKEYELKIPLGMGERFALLSDKIPRARKPGPAYARHKVRRGESLSIIAARYKTSVRAIVAANRLRDKHSIRAGKWLKIPSRGYRISSDRTSKPVAQGKVATGKIITYRVKRGDSLWLLANRFNTTISDIKRLSGLSRNSLYVGQVITIRNGNNASAPSSSKTYKVRKGDSLSVIAARHGISLARLLKLNKFNRTTILHPGQTITVREGNDIPASSSSKTYKVRKGDSLSVIAARHGTSLTRLLKLNKFNRATILHPGQIIIIKE